LLDVGFDLWFQENKIKGITTEIDVWFLFRRGRKALLTQNKAEFWDRNAMAEIKSSSDLSREAEAGRGRGRRRCAATWRI
jgi:hypothetical protein